MRNVQRRHWQVKLPDPKVVTAIFTFLGAFLGVVKEVLTVWRK